MFKRKVLSMFVMGGIATTLAIPSAFASDSENNQNQEREHTANHVHHHHHSHNKYHATLASHTYQSQNVQVAQNSQQATKASVAPSSPSVSKTQSSTTTVSSDTVNTNTSSSSSVSKPVAAAAPVSQPVAAQTVKSAAVPVAQPVAAQTVKSSPAATGQAVQSSEVLTASQQKLMEVAKSQIGVPYLWGHQVPGVGFDCSNFTSWVYKDALGINFSSSSRQQRYNNSIGRPVSLDPSNKLANLQVGDLLFFKNSADRGDGSVGLSTSGGGGHVGIYAGNGMVIQEGGGRAKVTYEKMAGTWFLPSLVYAKRILN